MKVPWTPVGSSTFMRKAKRTLVRQSGPGLCHTLGPKVTYMGIAVKKSLRKLRGPGCPHSKMRGSLTSAPFLNLFSHQC